MSNIALIKKVGEKPERVEIKGTTFDLIKETVGGYFDVARYNENLVKNKIDIFVNDEGKLMELYPNILVIDSETEKLVDYLAGDVIFLAYNDKGESLGLSEEQLDIINKEVFTDSCALTRDEEIFICNVIRI